MSFCDMSCDLLCDLSLSCDLSCDVMWFVHIGSDKSEERQVLAPITAGDKV